MFEGLANCQRPFCDVRFPQTGMKMKPRRYCCDECKVDAWAIRRVAKLLAKLSDDEAIQILKGEPMKQTDPMKFAAKLKWLDGSPLLNKIEPYRGRDLSAALYTFEPNGRPRYTSPDY